MTLLTDFFAGLSLSLQGAASQGVLWGVMALGVYVTFKVLDFADLTVDGSFALGGALSATLIVSGMNPYPSLLAALLAGMAAGVVTGLLHTKLQIPGILAGILTQIALYSINIRIIGAANVPLLGEDTVISLITGVLPLSKNWVTLLLGVAVAAVLIGALYWFFGTEMGCAIRATGSNENMVRALGGNTDTMKVVGLALSNGLVALSGGLVAQSQGYGDVGMGTGTIVIGLASIIIGEVIFGSRFNFAYKLMSVVLGSVIYRLIIAFVLRLGFRSTDLKLLTAIIVALALSIPVLRRSADLRIYGLILLGGAAGYGILALTVTEMTASGALPEDGSALTAVRLGVLAALGLALLLKWLHDRRRVSAALGR